jgi:flagellar protein FlaG
MGLEVLSNVGGTYREIPKEVMIKNDHAKQADVINFNNNAHLAQNETKAVVNAEHASEYYQNSGGKAPAYQNNGEKIKKAIEKANKAATQRTHCEFNYHEDTNRISISIKDDKTGDVIKEIPAEETLDMLSKMWEIAGLFIDDSV